MAKREEYDYEAREGMHTMMRAEEISKDKGLMKRVQKHAKEHAEKMREASERAGRLAKSGHISEKQMAKLKKTAPLAKGNEGSSAGSTNNRGISYD